jgi:hypothetical protein
MGVIMKYPLFVLFIVCGLFAQDSYQPLVLMKGGEKQIIPAGDWIVVVASGIDTILGRGKLIGIYGQNLVMLGDSTISVPLDQINTLYKGHYREVGRHSWRGLKTGAKAGLVTGVVSLPLAGFLGVEGIVGMILLPIGFATEFGIIGAVYGFFNGLIREKTAKKYLINPYQWEIVLK